MKTEQCFCKSYSDDDHKIQDCTCGKCDTQEIQEWELNMQNHLISACDWIEDVKIKQMTVAKILSRWAVVRDEFSQKLKEQEERHKREIVEIMQEHNE